MELRYNEAMKRWLLRGVLATLTLGLLCFFRGMTAGRVNTLWVFEDRFTERLLGIDSNANDAVLVSVEGYGHGFKPVQTGVSAEAMIAYFSNPGRAYVLYKGKKGALLKHEVDAIKRASERRGDRVHSLLRIDARCGPDGETPLVVASTLPMRSYDEHGQIRSDPESFTVTLVFPSKAVAFEAQTYIDPGSFRCSIHEVRPGGRAVLYASLLTVTPMYDQGSPWRSFGPLVRRYNGWVESVSSDYTPVAMR